jgi:hypothetical protein
MRKDEASRLNSLSALRKRQQQEEEERRRDQEYKARLEEIYLTRPARPSAVEPEEPVILDDAERRWRQDRQDRLDFHCRMLAELERHNHVLEQILSRLPERE